MKVADIEKTAAEIKERRNNTKLGIEQRKTAASRKLAELKKQAEALAVAQKLDEYAENLSAQRQQEDIITAAEKIGQRTAAQIQADTAAVQEFNTAAQHAFDEDVAENIKAIVKHINAAAAAADEYIDKLERTENARDNVAAAYNVPKRRGEVKSLFALAKEVQALRLSMESHKKKGTHGL